MSYYRGHSFLHLAERKFALQLLAWPLKQAIREWMLDPAPDAGEQRWHALLERVTQNCRGNHTRNILAALTDDIQGNIQAMRDAGMPDDAIPGHLSRQIIHGFALHPQVEIKLIGEHLDAPMPDDELFSEHSTYPMRRRIFDRIYAMGMEEVFAREEHEKEPFTLLRHLPSIEYREAKWEYMLALANEAYGLGFQSSEELQVMARAYAQLATFERGARNPYMAHEYRLRHNPAIHSLHVVGLVDDIFRRVKKAHPEFMQHADTANELEALRALLVRSALVHDMGELRGEKSVAGERAHLTPVELEAFEHGRAHAEASIWEREMRWHSGIYELERQGVLTADEARDLRKNHNRLIHVEQRIALAEKRIPDEAERTAEVAELNRRYERYHAIEARALEGLDLPSYARESTVMGWQEAFNLPDEQSLTGRIIKLLERLQTQQDYLRWNGKASAVPMRHMIDKPMEPDFKLGYTLDLILGEKNGGIERKENGLLHYLGAGGQSEVVRAVAEAALELARQTNIVICANLPERFPVSEATEATLRNVINVENAALLRGDANLAEAIRYFENIDWALGNRGA